uniref:Transposase_23 domain-containing protein n=1 Tax=Heterorhabditis bacteriophora TaxID=37862 RepID=A0A1I7WVH7_HETBA
MAFKRMIIITINSQRKTKSVIIRICMHADEDTCEKALLYYHRHKSEVLRKEKEPFHEQLLHLGDLSSDSRIRDREGTGMGVVVGLPGYEPLYVGAALNNKKDRELV